MAINSVLFKALESKFGKGKVRIAQAGVPAKLMYETYRDSDDNARLGAKREEYGEEYRVNCHKCGDSRHRLAINHLWGVPDAKTGSRNLHFIKCYNEECFPDSANARQLFDELMVDRFVGETGKITLEYDERGVKVRRTPELPGKLWRVDQMAKKIPQHAAVVYLERRLLSARILGEVYGVGYCHEPQRREAENRLIVPVRLNGKLMGWTGRYIGEPPSKEVPKWYHDPALKKSELFYNFDVAKEYHTKILVEGPGDVWGIGPCGMAVLGKTLSANQLELLSSCCTNDFAVVILLDPVQAEKERLKGRPHQIEAVHERLQELTQFRGRVLKVYLSADLDPGDADRAYMYSLIRRRAAEEKITIHLPELFHGKANLAL